MKNSQFVVFMLLATTILASYYAPKQQKSYGSSNYKPAVPNRPSVVYVVPPPSNPEYSSESESIEEECGDEECSAVVDNCVSSQDPNCVKMKINAQGKNTDVSCLCDDCDYLELLDENGNVVKSVSRTN